MPWIQGHNRRHTSIWTVYHLFHMFSWHFQYGISSGWFLKMVLAWLSLQQQTQTVNSGPKKQTTTYWSFQMHVIRSLTHLFGWCLVSNQTLKLIHYSFHVSCFFLGGGGGRWRCTVSETYKKIKRQQKKSQFGYELNMGQRSGQYQNKSYLSHSDFTFTLTDRIQGKSQERGVVGRGEGRSEKQGGGGGGWGGLKKNQKNLQSVGFEEKYHKLEFSSLDN